MSGSGSGLEKIMDPDPDLVCPERLDRGWIRIRSISDRSETLNYHAHSSLSVYIYRSGKECLEKGFMCKRILYSQVPLKTATMKDLKDKFTDLSMAEPHLGAPQVQDIPYLYPIGL